MSGSVVVYLVFLEGRLGTVGSLSVVYCCSTSRSYGDTKVQLHSVLLTIGFVRGVSPNHFSLDTFFNLSGRISSTRYNST